MGKTVLEKVPGFISRAGGESFLVDPFTIKVIPGWNKREDFTGEEELMGVIKNLEVPPILVKKTKDNELALVDGERRLRATKRLIKEGTPLPGIRVEVAPKNANDIDLCFRAVALNNSKPLLPVEQANFFKQLFSWGVSKQEIADKSGVCLSTVRLRLHLSDAIPAVKEAVKNNEITIKQANEIIEETDGGVDEQVKVLEVKKATPRTRTKKPVIVEYKEDSLCKSISCPRLDTPSEGQSDCRYHGNACIMTAKELLTYLKKEGYKITKETTD